ncbi:unnamed protein product [Mytilus edulis]|uniref:Uncharacterized protein n=1 Tax=Mytilus edulis TaxID=6550 RepID=A0A8S3V423_MYTED|nr:unnamed protein product [Mytilus edulis]
MTGRSIETRDSLSFYKYLCQTIGSEEDVRIRRLGFVIRDIGRNDIIFITSGSKGEGLNLNGSDLDLMFIDRYLKVYESEADVVLEGRGLPVMMYTEDTPPCFTLLHLLTYHKNQTLVRVSVSLLNILDTHHMGYALSSELFKISHLLSRGRRIVENAFGILCNKFQKKTLNDAENGQDIGTGLLKVPRGGSRNSCQARQIRDEFKEYFVTTGQVPWQANVVR